ncbi:hypothetical protein ABPG74_022615 [Tetrahymena malaccensis]
MIYIHKKTKESSPQQLFAFLEYKISYINQQLLEYEVINQEFEFNFDFTDNKNKFVEEKEDEFQSINIPSLMLKTKQKLDLKKQSTFNHENIYSSYIADQDKIVSQNQSFKLLSKLCSISYDQKECAIDERQTNISSSFKHQIKDCSQKLDQSLSSDSSPNQIFNRQIKRTITGKSKQKQRFSLKSVNQSDNNKFVEEKDETSSIIIPSLMLKTKQKLDLKKQNSVNYENVYSSQIGDQDKIITQNQSFKFLSKMCSVISYDQKDSFQEEKQANVSSFYKQQGKDNQQKIDQSIISDTSPNQLFNKQIKRVISDTIRIKNKSSIKNFSQTENQLNNQSNKSSQRDNQLEQILTQFGESRKLNYFEQQMQILQSQELQSRYIKKFIAKFHYKQDFDIIDQRILSSISKCNDTD